MKWVIAVLCVMTVSAASAGGYTSTAVPTRIDIVRGDGFMIFGAFGNPGTCVIGDQFLVKIDHPQYERIYAMAMTAYVSKQKVFAYITSCEPNTWYSVPTTTFNVLTSNSVLHITD